MTPYLLTQYNKHNQHKYFKPIILAVFLIILYFTYRIYIWVNTQSTDNAYLQSDITFLSTEISGTVKTVLLNDNAKVNKDDLIAVIDDRDFIANLNKSIASFTAQKKDIEALDIKINLEQINLEKAQITIKLEQSNANFAETDLKRSKALNKEKFTSQQILDKSETAYLEAKTQLIQAQLDFKTAELNLNLLNVQKSSAISILETLKQEKILSKKRLAETKIRSPIDGVLASHSIRVGSFVSPGMLLCAIVPNNNWYIKANFKETQIFKFTEGMTAELHFDSLPGKKYQGKIRGIYPSTGSNFSLIPIDTSTGNFTKIVQRVPVLIDFQAPQDLVLVPGMSAIVNIRTNL